MSRESSQALVSQARSIVDAPEQLKEWLRANMRNIDDPESLEELFDHVLEQSSSVVSVTASFLQTLLPISSFCRSLEYCPHVQHHPELYQRFIRYKVLPGIAQNQAETGRFPGHDLAADYLGYWKQRGIVIPGEGAEDYAGSIQDIVRFLKHGKPRQ